MAEEIEAQSQTIHDSSGNTIAEQLEETEKQSHKIDRKKRSAWQEAAWIFVLSRLVIVLLSYIGTGMFPRSGETSAHNCALDINSCLLAWYHWDAISYVNIAYHGYRLARDTVFFPLWPLLEHGVGVAFGPSSTSYYFAGLLLSNICFYFVLVLFYYLLNDDFGPQVAKNALFYLTFYPYAMFFFAGYTESLFVLLCLTVFLFLRRGKPLDWWLAGFFGFLAALTRASGVILVIPFLVVFIQRCWIGGEYDRQSWRQKLNAFVPIVLIPIGVLVYMIYLGYTQGNPLSFSTQEASSWSRHLSLPWNGLISTLQVFFTPSSLQVYNFRDIAFTLIPLVALATGWKHLPLHYSLFAVAMVIFSLSYPFIPLEPLSAAPRYMMSIFPIFVIFAVWGKHPCFDRVFVAFSLSVFAVNTILFISHYWVA